MPPRHGGIHGHLAGHWRPDVRLKDVAPDGHTHVVTDVDRQVGEAFKPCGREVVPAGPRADLVAYARQPALQFPHGAGHDVHLEAAVDQPGDEVPGVDGGAPAGGIELVDDDPDPWRSQAAGTVLDREPLLLGRNSGTGPRGAGVERGWLGTEAGRDRDSCLHPFGPAGSRSMTCERAIPGGAEWADLAAPHLSRYLMVAEFTAGRRVLPGLAAPGRADFPIVPAAPATVYGTPRFNVGICRRPVSGDSP
jgi:hypothetical protein